MHNKSIKEELLEILRGEMKEMMLEEKSNHMSDMMPSKDESEEMTEVTVQGDNPESVVEGLSKAEEIMKAKLGGDSTEEAIEDVMDVDLDDELKKKQPVL